jgi:HEAT repeat protein
MRFQRGLTTIAAVTVALVGESGALADIARLSNGGEVRGSFLSEPGGGDPLAMRTILGGRIVLSADTVRSTSRRPAEVEEYVTRSRSIPHTVEAHWELAEWCKARQLTSQREEQLEALLDVDPTHAAAHRALDHMLYQGQWMTRDEAMREQGYVKYKGKYLTQQEIDLLEKTTAQRQAEQSWYPKIRLWKGWVRGNHQGRQIEGLQQLRGVVDEDAVPALRDFLSDAPQLALRELYVERLTAMRGVKPVASLARTSLLDVDPAIRQAAFEGLGEDQRDAAIPYYVDALKDANNAVVNRAAVALGTIGDFRVVPALIRALVTSHKIAYDAPVPDTVTIGQMPNGRYSIGGTQSVVPPNIELLLRTGQLPYGVQLVNPPGARTRRVSARVNVSNEDVLASLRKLTNQDFGYNESAWLTYWDAYRSGQGKL